MASNSVPPPPLKDVSAARAVRTDSLPGWPEKIPDLFFFNCFLFLYRILSLIRAEVNLVRFALDQIYQTLFDVIEPVLRAGSRLGLISVDITDSTVPDAFPLSFDAESLEEFFVFVHFKLLFCAVDPDAAQTE